MRCSPESVLEVVSNKVIFSTKFGVIRNKYPYFDMKLAKKFLPTLICYLEPVSQVPPLFAGLVYRYMKDSATGRSYKQLVLKNKLG